MKHVLIVAFSAMIWNSQIAWCQEIWTTREATTSVELHAPIFKDLGITILTRDVTSEAFKPGADAFAVRTSEPLSFSVENGRMGAFNQGELRHFGGYQFHFTNLDWDLSDFVIRLAQPPYTFQWVDRDGMPWFLLTHAHPHLEPDESRLVLQNMDMEMAPELAALLGRPDLEGQYMGTTHMVFSIDVPAHSATQGGCVPDFTGDVDVVLTSVSSLSQGAREPGGRVALAVSATLANQGTADVPWYRAIAPDGGVGPEEIGQHPFLVLHIYQLKDGVFRQVAQSDVKHAFFSVNSLCACPGGQVLFVGCGDTYGAGTNLNREYLAPRPEVTASTGAWESLGSHFDGKPVDDFRHHSGFGHDDFEHRMVIEEALLLDSDSRFFVEAWYLVKDDINIFNSMGFREFEASLTGSVWSFSFPQLSLTRGPALDAWVNPEGLGLTSDHQALDTGEGHLRLAVSVEDLGNNTYRYEYALLNLDFDHQIQAFEIPLPLESIIQFASFSDRDSDAGNNWVANITSEKITWQAPGGNSLDWGTQFNFGFTANGAPAARTSLLSPLEGDPNALMMQSLGPNNPCLPFHLFVESLPQWPSQATVTNLIQNLGTLCPAD